MSQRHFVIRVIYFIKYIKLPSALINLELSVVEILVKILFYFFFPILPCVIGPHFEVLMLISN